MIDENRHSIGCSLPPQITGVVCGEIFLVVHSVIPHESFTLPSSIQIRTRWWGEAQPGSLLLLNDPRRYPIISPSTENTSPISSYFADMKKLRLDIIDKSTHRIFGRSFLSLTNDDDTSDTASVVFPYISPTERIPIIKKNDSNNTVIAYISVTMETRWKRESLAWRLSLATTEDEQLSLASFELNESLASVVDLPTTKTTLNSARAFSTTSSRDAPSVVQAAHPPTTSVMMHSNIDLASLIAKGKSLRDEMSRAMVGNNDTSAFHDDDDATTSSIITEQVLAQDNVSDLELETLLASTSKNNATLEYNDDNTSLSKAFTAVAITVSLDSVTIDSRMFKTPNGPTIFSIAYVKPTVEISDRKNLILNSINVTGTTVSNTDPKVIIESFYSKSGGDEQTEEYVFKLNHENRRYGLWNSENSFDIDSMIMNSSFQLYVIKTSNNSSRIVAQSQVLNLGDLLIFKKQMPSNLNLSYIPRYNDSGNENTVVGTLQGFKMTLIDCDGENVNATTPAAHTTSYNSVGIMTSSDKENILPKSITSSNTSIEKQVKPPRVFKLGLFRAFNLKNVQSQSLSLRYFNSSTKQVEFTTKVFGTGNYQFTADFNVTSLVSTSGSVFYVEVWKNDCLLFGIVKIPTTTKITSNDSSVLVVLDIVDPLSNNAIIGNINGYLVQEASSANIVPLADNVITTPKDLSNAAARLIQRWYKKLLIKHKKQEESSLEEITTSSSNIEKEEESVTDTTTSNNNVEGEDGGEKYNNECSMVISRFFKKYCLDTTLELLVELPEVCPSSLGNEKGVFVSLNKDLSESTDTMMWWDKNSTLRNTIGRIEARKKDEVILSLHSDKNAKCRLGRTDPIKLSDHLETGQCRFMTVPLCNNIISSSTLNTHHIPVILELQKKNADDSSDIMNTTRENDDDDDDSSPLRTVCFAFTFLEANDHDNNNNRHLEYEFYSAQNKRNVVKKFTSSTISSTDVYITPELRHNVMTRELKVTLFDKHQCVGYGVVHSLDNLFTSIDGVSQVLNIGSDRVLLEVYFSHNRIIHDDESSSSSSSQEVSSIMQDDDQKDHTATNVTALGNSLEESVVVEPLTVQVTIESARIIMTRNSSTYYCTFTYDDGDTLHQTLPQHQHKGVVTWNHSVIIKDPVRESRKEYKTGEDVLLINCWENVADNIIDNVVQIGSVRVDLGMLSMTESSSTEARGGIDGWYHIRDSMRRRTSSSNDDDDIIGQLKARVSILSTDSFEKVESRINEEHSSSLPRSIYYDNVIGTKTTIESAVTNLENLTRRLQLRLAGESWEAQDSSTSEEQVDCCNDSSAVDDLVKEDEEVTLPTVDSSSPSDQDNDDISANSLSRTTEQILVTKDSVDTMIKDIAPSLVVDRGDKEVVVSQTNSVAQVEDDYIDAVVEKMMLREKQQQESDPVVISSTADLSPTKESMSSPLDNVEILPGTHLPETAPIGRGIITNDNSTTTTTEEKLRSNECNDDISSTSSSSPKKEKCANAVEILPGTHLGVTSPIGPSRTNTTEEQCKLEEERSINTREILPGIASPIQTSLIKESVSDNESSTSPPRDTNTSAEILLGIEPSTSDTKESTESNETNIISTKKDEQCTYNNTTDALTTTVENLPSTNVTKDQFVPDNIIEDDIILFSARKEEQFSNTTSKESLPQISFTKEEDDRKGYKDDDAMSAMTASLLELSEKKQQFSDTRNTWSNDDNDVIEEKILLHTDEEEEKASKDLLSSESVPALLQRDNDFSVLPSYPPVAAKDSKTKWLEEKLLLESEIVIQDSKEVEVINEAHRLKESKQQRRRQRYGDDETERIAKIMQGSLDYWDKGRRDYDSYDSDY